MATQTRCDWTVTGMDCGSCAGKVRGAVERLPGVSGVEVTLIAERLRLTLDEALTPRAEIEAAIRALGFGIAPEGTPPERRKGFVLPGALPEPAPDPEPQNVPPPASLPWHRTAKGRLLLVTGGLLAGAWGVKLTAAAALAEAAFVLACLIGLLPVARRAWAALRRGMPFTIEALMTLAAGGALVLGAAEEAAFVLFLFAVGEVLEGLAAQRARSGIRALARLAPETARLEVGGALREVRAAALRAGQVVLVRAGDRVPADGIIVEGTSGLDESPVTGESVPRTRGPGDEVLAGTINTEAALRVRVSRPASDSAIARIVRLVEEAESARAPTERFIDRFSRWYMPSIVGVAALVAILPPLVLGLPWPDWSYRALALLLIGCPCALVISVPAAIASALAAGARRGLLLKGGAVVEVAAATTRVAFDKTGTLTCGRPNVTAIVALNGDEDTVLALAAAVEIGAAHPLARAIRDEAARRRLTLPPVQGARVLPGIGAEAGIDGALVRVTAPRSAAEAGALDQEALHHAARLEKDGQTVVALYRGAEGLGLIALRDEPRPDAAAALAQLRAMGIATVMLTGDTPRTAAAIAGPLGADWQAGMLPADKRDAIRDMGAGVMMVGDGINDAPALKQAAVGVAMGSGTDVALETADAAILRDRVTDVPAMVRLARAAMANIRQNVAIALGLKAVFLVTSIAGVTGLWMAVLADTGATVLVTLNALRLLRFDPERDTSPPA